MDDQFAVSVLDGLADLFEKGEPGGNRQPLLVTESVYTAATNIFHDEVGAAVLVHPYLVEPGDVGVLERSQDALFQEEARPELRTEGTRRDPFDRDASLVATILALGQVHHAHSAAPEKSEHAPGANALGKARRRVAGTDERSCFRLGDRLDQQRGRELDGR